ncbi:CidA/LrgA family protein [Parageobacillus toebii]|uniref:CidA/LrgA family protein n=1 Tax=Parageobacillus toebii TaxID=153151 RepID=UPI001F24C7FF|nr:CidA/LrgA family protein [Parageobacillus toebii]
MIPQIMTIIRTILQILILYIFYYIGVLIVNVTHLPFPPSVIGLLLLFLCLQRKWIKVGIIQQGASFLIGFMTLFFIPSMLGIVEYPELLSMKGILLIVTVFASTVLTIYLTSIFSGIIERKERGLKGKEDGGVERHHLYH